MVPVTEPAGNGSTDPLSSLTFSDAAPLPDDAPDFTASQDFDHGANATPVGEVKPPRRRLLPRNRSQNGTQDNATSRVRDRSIPKPPRAERPLPPIPAKGFAPGVQKMYEALALAVSPFDVKLGETLTSIAPEAAQAWDELARQNHMVRRFLVAMMETTAWGQVIAAHAPLVGLMFARMMGNDVRVSMVGLLMGQEAEKHANGDDRNGPSAS
jgi:hypothetical protein